jgi:hypothetical protein
MRLAVVENGLSPVQKLLSRVVRLAAGQVPGPILTFSYKKDLFGKAFTACLQEAMRRPTAWTVGEVELFAAFVSKLNRCAY